MRLRWLAFATMIGVWSTDAFVISTTIAVGLGAFLVAQLALVLLLMLLERGRA